jgi:NAD(P)-dependent dehydrogenase (short-subunit alcohol dehydrogenase family)
MPDGEHAAVGGMQPLARNAVVDSALSEPEIAQLGAGDQAVLTRRERRDRRVRRSRVIFAPYDRANITLDSHARIVAARACRITTRSPRFSARGAPIICGGMARLDGTRALVTGATSGLGRAMATALAGAGARVAVTSRDRARAEDAGERTGAALALSLDVRDERSVQAAVDATYDRLGGVDLLVNNAGIGMRTVNPRFLTDPQPFHTVTPDGFRAVVETKLTGCFLVARALVPRMLQSGGGRVVNISMNHQTMVRAGFVPYGPAGAAVEALSRVMAADLAGTSVTVNLLLPGGATATGMVPDEAPAEIRDGLLDPAVMGPPIVWLASPEAAGVHDERIVAVEFDRWLEQRARA